MNLHAKAGSPYAFESELPDAIVSYVGENPEILWESGEVVVYAGGGYQAHVGPPDAVARERLVLLRELAKDIPLFLPQVLDWDITWTVVEDLRPTDAWSDEDVMAAVAELSRLHETFERSDDLTSPLLRRPFDRDCDEVLAPARECGWQLPDPLAQLLEDPSPLLEVLGCMPETLLHGDPWPANVALRGSERVWLNWWQLSVGPGVADLASWLDQTPFQLGRVVDRLTEIEAYLAARDEPFDRKLFGAALDASRIFWFLACDVPQLPELAAQRPDLAETMNREALRALEAFERQRG